MRGGEAGGEQYGEGFGGQGDPVCLASVKAVADDHSGRVRYGAIQADDAKIGRTMSALTAQLDDGQLPRRE